jgi:hypothetical protein
MVKTAAGCRIFKVFVIFASLVRSGGRNAECLKFSCYLDFEQKNYNLRPKRAMYAINTVNEGRA